METSLMDRLTTIPSHNKLISSLMSKENRFMPSNASRKAILEMHENSESSAFMYVLIVLGLYVIGLALVLNKYLRTQQYEGRLYSLYDNFLRGDSFLVRWSKRRRLQEDYRPDDSTVNNNNVNDHNAAGTSQTSTAIHDDP